MKNKVKLSIIIRVKNEEKVVGKLLEKLLSQKIKDQFEIIVIDNCSTDKTKSVVSTYPVKLLKLKSSQFTFGYALNLGAKISAGKYIVNLSADCMPTNKYWLSNLTNPLRKNSVIAAYGRQLPIPGVNPFEELKLKRWYPPKGVKLLSRTAFSNANCAIKRRIWSKHKFNEEIVSMEDWLWYEQVKNVGKIEYVPSAAVYHSHPLVRLHRFYNRVKRDGIAFYYLREFYNLDVREHRKSLTDLPSAFEAITTYLRQVTLFMIKKRYYNFLILFPLYQFIHEVAFFKGRQLGRKLYN